MINWTLVESSAIARIGYDGKDLFVKFKGFEPGAGSTYQYFEVPEFVYVEFMTSPSKGKFHDEYILSRYNSKKMSTPKPTSTQYFTG